MPCQRAKNKVRFGGYLDRKLHSEIVELANCEGMSRDKFGFLKRLLREALEPALPALPAKNPLPVNSQIASARGLTDRRQYPLQPIVGRRPA
jgi:hypothetical protein